MSRADYEVAVVGGGPNGLTAAAYLARAGARVVLLEKRFERGGTFATDDYSTPFQYNLAQFELPLGRELPPYRDLELESQGVQFVEPEHPFSVQAEPRGDELLIGRGGSGLGGEVEEMLAAASEAVTPLLYMQPREEEAVLAELGGSGAGGAGAARGAAGARAAAASGAAAGGAVGGAALAAHSPRTLAARATDPRAAIALRYACRLAGFLDGDSRLGLIGGFAVARLFSPVIVAGGTKNLANALFRAAASAGARCLVSSEVTRVERDGGERFRLRLADGRELGAGAVVSTLDPKSTFLELLDGDLVDAELGDAAENWAVEPTGQYTAHFGIKGDPGADGSQALMRVFGFQDADDVEQRFQTVMRGELPRAIAGHLTVVSAHDPLQASPGPYGPLHTLRLQTAVPLRHPDGPWERARPDYRRACWDAALAHFDGLDSARLLFQFSDTPLDLERRFGTTRNGSLRQGALAPEQTLARRFPARTGISSLYLAGGGAHPGVPGSLGGGYNAAALIAAERGLGRAP